MKNEDRTPSEPPPRKAHGSTTAPAEPAPVPDSPWRKLRRFSNTTPGRIVMLAPLGAVGAPPHAGIHAVAAAATSRRSTQRIQVVGPMATRSDDRPPRGGCQSGMSWKPQTLETWAGWWRSEDLV